MSNSCKPFIRFAKTKKNKSTIRGTQYLGTMRIVPVSGPHPATNKPISGSYSPHHVNQEPDCHISNVFGEHATGVGDSDPPPPALRQVDVVDSGAGGDDESERREEAEDAGGDGTGAGTEDGLDGAGVGGEEQVGGEWGFVGFEELEIGGEVVVESGENWWRTED